MRAMILAGLTIIAAPASAQTSTPSITFYELPGYLGRSITVTSETADLATQGFAKRAQSARVTGSWQVCPNTSFAGSCRTLTANTPLLIKSQVVSLRPTPSDAGASSGTTAAAAIPGSTSTTAATIDLDALDVSTGTDGQDVTFFARPALGGTEVSAGTNDITAANAFCKLAGASSASYAGRARVQTSNLIDVATKSKVRSFALRDVVCRR